MISIPSAGGKNGKTGYNRYRVPVPPLRFRGSIRQSSYGKGGQRYRSAYEGRYQGRERNGEMNRFTNNLRADLLGY